MKTVSRSRYKQQHRQMHRDPYERKLMLLRYLADADKKSFNNKKSVTITSASSIMEMNTKHGIPFAREMEKEGLIKIHRPDYPAFVKGVVTITQKGLVAGNMLTQMIGMCSKGGEYLH